MKELGDIKGLKRMLEESRRVLIATHVRPDGDAIGSAGALQAQICSLQGKQALICIEGDIPQNLSFLASGMPIRGEVTQALEQWADLIICTDCSCLDRTGEKSAAILRASKKPGILMDHHENPAREEFSLVFSKTCISSASELVYWIFKEMGWIPVPEAARCILAGMTTDTNNFANSVYPSTLRMTSELIELGVDRQEILDKLYNSYSENRVRAMSHFTGKMKILPCGFAYMVIRSREWESFALREGDLEGLVNIPLSIAAVHMSATFREDGSLFRVSLRSKKGWSALDMARSLFHGGGHIQASGGKVLIPEDIRDAEGLEKFIEENVRL